MLLIWPCGLHLIEPVEQEIDAVGPNTLRHGNTLDAVATAQELLHGVQSAFTVHRDKTLELCADVAGIA
jgi:hypothetical protein